MERITTDIFNKNTLEHLHRYTVACEYVKGKKVLDIASGEGYGSNLMAAFAASVVGVDIDQGAVHNALKKYKRENLEYRHGNATSIPLEDNAVDVVVSFETIEHLSEHELFLQEIKRVLKPGGLLIISSPDREVYTDQSGFNNPFHEKELNRKEFEALVGDHFSHQLMLAQKVALCSVLSPDTEKDSVFRKYTGDFTKTHKASFPGQPQYHLCFASDKKLDIQPTSSIFHIDGILEQIIKQRQLLYRNSAAYRIGSLFVNPIKKIGRLFH